MCGEAGIDRSVVDRVVSLTGTGEPGGVDGEFVHNVIAFYPTGKIIYSCIV